MNTNTNSRQRPFSSSTVDTFSTSNRVASLIQSEKENYFQRRNDYAVYDKNQHTLNTLRTDRSRKSEEWVLPSSRKEYIRNHDATKLAQLYSSDKNIAPVWTKVTKTPWTDKATLCTGYGVAMERTKISTDAPTYFLDPHSQYSTNHSSSVHHPRFGKTSFTRTFSKGSKGNQPNESAYVLPGGQSILDANLKSSETFSRSNYRKFFHGKQAYIDYKAPPRTAPPTPINWEDDRHEY